MCSPSNSGGPFGGAVFSKNPNRISPEELGVTIPKHFSMGAGMGLSIQLQKQLRLRQAQAAQQVASPLQAGAAPQPADPLAGTAGKTINDAPQAFADQPSKVANTFLQAGGSQGQKSGSGYKVVG